MKKQHRYFQKKLMHSYSLFMLVMIVFSTCYWVVQLHREQNAALVRQLSLLAIQGNAAIDTMISHAKPVLYMHVENNLIEQVLNRADTGDVWNAAPLNLYYLEQGALQQNPDLISITFIDLKGNVYSSHQTPVLSVTPEKFISLAQGRNGIPYIGIPTSEIIHRERKQVIPICKELISIKTGRSIGYVLVTMDFSKMCRDIDSMTDFSGGYYTMLLAGEQSLYSSNVSHHLFDTFKSGFSLKNMHLISDSSGTYNYYRDRDICVYGVTNELTGWTVLKFCGIHRFSFDFSFRIIIFIAISLIFFCIMLVIASRVSKRLSRNISLLHQAFASSEVPALSKIADNSISDDEIGDLIIGFNRMIDCLQTSIEKEYATAIRAQEMRIKMLNYQINPHFLYNCLNIISSLSMLHHVPEIGRVTRILGEMFHYSIESRDIVTIRDEMNHIVDYLEIQKVRFPDQFQVDYKVDSLLLDLPCIKFILQPVIENVFSHGFLSSSSRKEHRISIEIRREDDDIILTVEDNGDGIEADTLAAIHQNLYAQTNAISSSQVSIGLWNIHKRIEAYYGSPYGLQIESEVGEYTRVTLRFPIKKEEKG